MRILGIETSCDETAVAVVEDGQRLLSWAMASSADMHMKTGGIIPEHAAREQVKAIIPTIDEALNELEEKTGSREFDALAVTHGPGLIGSLLIGVESAKTLSWVWQKPLVPVNHLIGHMYANYLETPPLRHARRGSAGQAQSPLSPKLPQFPYITLIVSGGHTDLVLVQDHGKWRWLGGTRDDAAGEAFDKVARLLGLGFPGGPAIQKAAQQLQSSPDYLNYQNHPYLPDLPRPMLHSGDYDFSFSGLKTATQTLISARSHPVQEERGVIAAAFQEAVVDVLVAKTLKAAQEYHAKAILLAGGVAANARLRERLQNEAQLPVFIPDVRFCTDNGAMIAAAAFYCYKPEQWENINTSPGLYL